MARFEAGFVVNRFDGKNRICRNGLFFGDAKSLWAAGINPCSYEYTLEVLSSLGKVLSGEIIEYEWGGGERTWFNSTKELTTATDNFAWQADEAMSTIEIIEMLEKKRHLMEDWPREKTLELLEKSFDVIKKEPINHIEPGEEYIYCYYDIVNNLKIKLILLEEDSNMGTQDYLDQLAFDSTFFKSTKTKS